MLDALESMFKFDLNLDLLVKENGIVFKAKRRSRAACFFIVLLFGDYVINHSVNAYLCGEASCMIDSFDFCKKSGMSTRSVAILMAVTAFLRETSLCALPMLFMAQTLEVTCRLQNLQQYLSEIMTRPDDGNGNVQYDKVTDMT